MNKHIPHFALIYGYDKPSKTFSIADYFNNKYSFEKASLMS